MGRSAPFHSRRRVVALRRVVRQSNAKPDTGQIRACVHYKWCMVECRAITRRYPVAMRQPQGEKESYMKRTIGVGEKAVLRIRVSEKDVHYAGGLVNGAYVLGLFGDAGTEVLIRFDGDEGLLAAYSNIELKSPVKAGDFLEVTGWVTRVGSTSRTIQLEAHRYIKVTGEPFESSADYLAQPELVARAEMVSVVRREQQRCSD